MCIEKSNNCKFPLQQCYCVSYFPRNNSYNKKVDLKVQFTSYISNK